MIPTALNDWTLETIKLLLGSGFIESDRLDWKEMLPHKRDEKDKERLRQTCAALANASGGFLVFGVKDNSALTPDARIVGMEASSELAAHFGNYASECIPPVQWEHRNPPLLLASGRVVFVVHIPPSWRAPHAVRTGSRDLAFWKRTNKGNEQMAYDDIRASFEGRRHRERVLKALKVELIMIERALRDLCDNRDPFGGLDLDLGPLASLTPELLGYFSDHGIEVLGDLRAFLTLKVGRGRRVAARFANLHSINDVALMGPMSEGYEWFIADVHATAQPMIAELVAETDQILSNQ